LLNRLAAGNLSISSGSVSIVSVIARSFDLVLSFRLDRSALLVLFRGLDSSSHQVLSSISAVLVFDGALNCSGSFALSGAFLDGWLALLI
jgi:hypothetical protein